MSYTIKVSDYGVWRSLVARVFWEHEVEGSNPFTPTKNLSSFDSWFFYVNLFTNYLLFIYYIYHLRSVGSCGFEKVRLGRPQSFHPDQKNLSSFDSWFFYVNLFLIIFFLFIIYTSLTIYGFGFEKVRLGRFESFQPDQKLTQLL